MKVGNDFFLNIINQNMKNLVKPIIIIVLLAFYANIHAQSDTLVSDQDSINIAAIQEYRLKLEETAKQREADSIRKVELEARLNSLKTADNIQKEMLQEQLQEISDRESMRLTQKIDRINSLRLNAVAYPVIGAMSDTLFLIYAKIGASTARDRAASVSKKLKILYDDDFLNTDSIITIDSENTRDIVYGETIIMSVSETDALWNNTTIQKLANNYELVIRNSIINAKREHRLYKILLRIGLILLILFGVYFMIVATGKLHKKLVVSSFENKEKWLKNLTYNDYTFLTKDQEYKFILFFFKIIRWFFVVLILYIALPLIFSIFPFTRGWAESLLNLIWSPFKGIILSVWNYFPNLVTILVIYFVMKYFVRFVRYIFSEIEAEKLKISGFHADWAMPTFSIVKFLLYAFFFVLIFQYLPGSDSNVFKGVSIFLGVLFSLGSSSAIANMIAGLVITYMRPFKIGDRIKIGDTVGDVVEKTLLVTRLRTVKNEEITIPNASVLSGSTINYSFHEKTEGLIIHTTVSIGYDVPWKNVHQALIEAALRTDLILKDPAPFVLQLSLDDFYVSYQINAFINNANKQAITYSSLNQNIQDVFNEKGIEIMSPHYRAQRDGNTTTIPTDYLEKN